jgi:hypothetical protein
LRLIILKIEPEGALVLLQLGIILSAVFAAERHNLIE